MCGHGVLYLVRVRVRVRVRVTVRVSVRVRADGILYLEQGLVKT